MYFYTGVGSRNTPPHILELMTIIAKKMNMYGFTLRSGGAEGADKAFEKGAGNKKEIFLAHQTTPEAEKIAAQFHPAWDRCKPFARRLHGRNSFQVLGINLDDPSSYCICWTPDGVLNHEQRTIKTGGTGTAISIADYYGVPVVNLAVPEIYEMWNLWAYNS